MIEVELLNAKAVRRAWKTLPTQLRRKAVRRGVREVAKKVKDATVGAIVSQGLVLTGAMKRNVYITSRSRGEEISMRVNVGNRQRLGIASDSKWYYPAHLEYGTKNISPKRFVRGTFDAMKDGLLRDIEREVNRQLLAAR